MVEEFLPDGGKFGRVVADVFGGADSEDVFALDGDVGR